MSTEANADLALAGRLAGPPRALRVALAARSAAYLVDAEPHTSPTIRHDLDRGAVCAVVESDAVVVPDAIVLPSGQRWARVLAAHLADERPVLLGEGVIRCGAAVVPVRASIDNTTAPLQRTLGTTDPSDLALLARTAAERLGATRTRLARATRGPARPLPWPALDHEWSGGTATPEALARDAHRLIGKGPGLTPSGDDLCSGVLLIHHLFGTAGIADAATEVLTLARTRTTTASHLLLRAASQGRAAVAVRAVLAALFADRAPCDLEVRVAGLLALGHTSGADLADGLRDGLRAAASSPLSHPCVHPCVHPRINSGIRTPRAVRRPVRPSTVVHREELRMSATSTDVHHVEVRRGRYVDSVSLMQVSATVAATPGVRKAQVAMATELNLDVLVSMGFEIPAEAGANDMVVAVAAESDDAVGAALATMEDAIAAIGSSKGSGSGFGGEPEPRTTRWALERNDAPLAVVSVPGEHAFAESMGALDAGRSVLVFSDNVPLAHEIRLKQTAAERGLLVMGPDCGTAIVGGVGLGFANVVRRGVVGVAAASGTGAQQFTSLLHTAGIGVSHCLGLGGRDLSEAVGGLSARAALAALDADSATEVIVVVSKPPHPDVARDLEEYAATLSTPVHFVLLGTGQPTITAGVEKVLGELGVAVPEWPTWGVPATAPQVKGALRGLFAGGTLCDESMLLAAETLGDIHSNIPLRPEWALGADLAHDSHLMIDFGDDTMTQGRPHPMIDPGLRLARLAQEAADENAAVVLLDVVLGYGAHDDPAADLAPALAEARRTAAASGRELAVVISLCGTDADPQGLEAQASALASAGAAVFSSNAAATRYAVALVTGGQS